MKRRLPNANAKSDGSVSKKRKCLSGKVLKGSFEHRFERRRYLNELAHEFQNTSAMEAKQQVLANLANFAYDPYNYHFFQEIGVIPIFLAELSIDRDESLTEFALAGICNCVADNRIQKEILKLNGIPSIQKYTYSSSVDRILSSITTLITFVNGGSFIKDELVTENFSNHLIKLRTHEDKRVQNVAHILMSEIGLT